MAYKQAEKDALFAASYEFYNINDKYIQDRVKKFIKTFKWASEHSNLVFVYFRTLIDYKVISELSGTNDIRLRNSMVTAVEKLHARLFSYAPKFKRVSPPGHEEAKKSTEVSNMNQKELKALFNPMMLIEDMDDNIDNNNIESDEPLQVMEVQEEEYDLSHDNFNGKNHN